ncbi:MAG: MAPEG family protein [Henriciella sp.]|nr:MAPEG family protein [Henriciella sp.]
MTAYGAVTLYVGLFVLLFIALKMNCGRVRLGEKVNIGDGGSAAMQRAMRVQANAVEDVPIVLLGLFGLAALAAPVLLIHVLGGGFLVLRLLHALGMGGASGFGKGRMIGTLGTMLVMLGTAGACIWYAVT